MISFSLFGLGLLLIGIAIAWEIIREKQDKADSRIPQHLATVGYLLCCVVWLVCAGYLAATIPIISN